MVKLNIHCPHFNTCSGCIYNDIKSDPKIFKKAKIYLEKVLNDSIELKKSNAKHWRTRAKLAVRKNTSDPKKPLIGLFEEGTHRVIPIPHCQIHHPKINEAIELMVSEFQKRDLTFYDEDAHTGDLRYIQLIVERRTNKVLLCFVVSFEETSEKKQQWESFAKILFENPIWHSIWMNFQPLKTNVIFGPTTRHIVGPRDIWENICNNEIAFGPVHFGQANLEMFEKLLETIRKHIPRNKNVLELYAGAGSIGLSVLDLCNTITFFERDKNALQLFEKSKAHINPFLQQRISYHIDISENAHEYIKNAEVVIVDPPRKGLSKNVLQSIVSSSTVDELIYISCDFETFERDARQLWKEQKGFYLEKAFCFLFFPGSNHIETLGFFKRK